MISKIVIRNSIVREFATLDEFRELIFRLDDAVDQHVSYDNIAGSTLEGRILSLVGWCERRGYTGRLVETCAEMRPGMEWK